MKEDFYPNIYKLNGKTAEAIPMALIPEKFLFPYASVSNLAIRQRTPAKSLGKTPPKPVDSLCRKGNGFEKAGLSTGGAHRRGGVIHRIVIIHNLVFAVKNCVFHRNPRSNHKQKEFFFFSNMNR
jgi:hypothetical protein